MYPSIISSMFSVFCRRATPPGLFYCCGTKTINCYSAISQQFTMDHTKTEKPFSFSYLAKKAFNYETQSEIKTLFMKWSMKGRLLAQTFNFDQPYQVYHKDKIFNDFFHSRDVCGYLNYLSKDGSGMAFSGENVAKVEAEQLNATVLSLEFFDRIYNNNVVRQSGHICQCLSESYEGVEISDELRKMLLIDDSDFYSLFDESDRKELLFRIFMHICLGGELCQPEETVQPLFDTAKAIYKECVSVAKDPSANKIRVISDVFQLKAYDEHENLLFPCEEDHIQNFAYAAVDPIKRHVTILYHRFGIGELPKVN